MDSLNKEEITRQIIKDSLMIRVVSYVNILSFIGMFLSLIWVLWGNYNESIKVLCTCFLMAVVSGYLYNLITNQVSDLIEKEIQKHETGMKVSSKFKNRLEKAKKELSEH